jgi:POT family proton-dependent oligopeptide transporter
MFKGHPKGLISAALANMGERFGFYIMMAILSLFISAKFGLDETTTGYIYSAFYASIYLLSLVGGRIADKNKNYKGTILIGIIVMALGYVMIAIPTPTPVPNKALYLGITCIGLFVIAFGNGLFKGNLQALVGQMYNKPEYKEKQESGFQLFYMFINVGALFSPFIAVGVRNWWLMANNFLYNSSLPELCHEYGAQGSAMIPERLEQLTTYANNAIADGSSIPDMGTFVNQYLDVFSVGFQYAFMAAVIMMGVSLIIYLANKAKFPDLSAKAKLADISTKAEKTEKSEHTQEEIQMDIKEIKQRVYALFAVFGIVIFFWFAFHQNGYSLTYFARDYIDLAAIKIDLGFTQIIGAEIFAAVNPIFVVALTPIIVWFFGFLEKKKINLSTPKKIAFGMGIASLAYVFLMVFSFALPTKDALGTMSPDAIDAMKLTPWVMIGLYFILTVAELFISPLGIAFVAKVAPPHMQGVMQGAWLAATAVGNSILFIGGILYTSSPMWLTWFIFVAACGLSMFVMLGMVKWLERVAK